MAQLNFTVIIPWSSVYSTATRLSSYEGRGAVTPSGESGYPDVHIASQDEELIKEYISQGMMSLEDNLTTLISGVSLTGLTGGATSISETSTMFSFVIDSARVGHSTLQHMISEAVASYVMIMWLSERKTERVEFYQKLYDQMISSIKKSMTRKNKPSLDITY